MEGAEAFTWPVRIYYEDTDAGGVVYYANYLKYCERARTEWLRSLGIGQRCLAAEGVLFVVREAQLSLLRPAYLDDLLQLRTRIAQQRAVALTFEQTFWREEEQLAQATVQVVCVDAERFRPQPLPPLLRRGLAQKSSL